MLKKNEFKSVTGITTPIIEHIVLDVIVIKEQLFHSLKTSPSDFSVYYQPIYQINNLINPSAFEALARWSNPYNLGPAQFMQIIESDDYLRRKFAMLISQQVLAGAQLLLSYSPNLQYVSLNVTFNDLNEPHYVEALKHLILKYPSVHSRIVIEITETQRVHLTKKFIDNISELHKIGVDVALDDLGAGFSTIDLVQLSIWQFVKLDKKLVEGIEKSEKKYQNLKLTIEQCLPYQSKLVIEGIENIKQHVLINQIENSNLLLQGYYYGKPKSISSTIKDIYNNTYSSCEF
ncbi:EAL domain-containing protein [Vibrio sp. T20]|uniref:EAL domain-containing protein n=1 Tax=Vibrio sp. T20 TaxID=2588450 RepID=UPI0016450C1F|nr:EAL domain-containing protein [Vibrio sp. T20]